MKSFVFAMALIGTLLTGVSAVAQQENGPVQDQPVQPAPGSQAQPALSCTVQVEGSAPQVQLLVGVQSESSSDFVILQLTDKGEQTLFFTQMEKGAFTNALTQGNITSLMLQENFAQDAGVIRNAGIFTVSFDGAAGSGLFVAKGHVYPLTCTK